VVSRIRNGKLDPLPESVDWARERLARLGREIEHIDRQLAADLSRGPDYGDWRARATRARDLFKLEVELTGEWLEGAMVYIVEPTEAEREAENFWKGGA
jgi:hypothetical protein